MSRADLAVSQSEVPDMTSHRACAMASLLLLASLPAAAADSTGLSYEVRFTEEEMTLDGQAREKSWALAPAIELTDRHYPGLIAIDSVSTRVKALWNDKGLLVLYHCLDADIKAEVTERDGRVYTDDTVELFLDPDMDGTYYLQVAVNPRSARRDLLIPEAGGRTSTRTWDSGLLCAVTGERTVLDRSDRDEWWTVEMFLPWSGLGRKALELSWERDGVTYGVDARDVLGEQAVPPKAGDRWRANFNRFDQGRGEAKVITDDEGGQIGYKDGDVASGWGVSPTSGSFHVPDYWGVLVFVKEE